MTACVWDNLDRNLLPTILLTIVVAVISFGVFDGRNIWVVGVIAGSILALNGARMMYAVDRHSKRCKKLGCRHSSGDPRGVIGGVYAILGVIIIASKTF